MSVPRKVSIAEAARVCSAAATNSGIFLPGCNLKCNKWVKLQVEALPAMGLLYCCSQQLDRHILYMWHIQGQQLPRTLMPDYNLKWKWVFLLQLLTARQCNVRTVQWASWVTAAAARAVTETPWPCKLASFASLPQKQKQCPTGGKLQSAFLDFVAPAFNTLVSTTQCNSCNSSNLYHTYLGRGQNGK